MNKVNIVINNQHLIVNSDETILQAALKENIYIPNLCYHPDLSPFASCRLCVVEINNMRGFPTACTTKVAEGMIIQTNTKTLNEIRINSMQLILSEHPQECLTCVKNLKCELQVMSAYFGIEQNAFPGLKRQMVKDVDNPLFVRDNNKCILCGRCIRACQELRGVGAIDFIYRGYDTIIGTRFNKPLTESDCRFCTACVEVCPTAALIDKNYKWLPKTEKEKFLVPCLYACPANIDIPEYVKLVSEGKYTEALAVIREMVPFPAILGRVCFHPCELACRRNDLNSPISIRNLKRIASDKGDDTYWSQHLVMQPPMNISVAIIGSGPAGLTAAYHLMRSGYQVNLYEALPELGGMMRYGIPSYRLPRAILDKEINDIVKMGLKVFANKKIENIDELFQDNQAILIATGAQLGMKLNIEGENLPGVYDCVQFLRDVAEAKPLNIGESVGVIGGGNAAMDSARTALRLGAKKVTILYRRSQKEMPANLEEIEESLEEGVVIECLNSPVKVLKVGNKIKLTCAQMMLGEPDESGRRKPIPIQGCDMEKEFDTLILAVGQISEIPENWKININKGVISVKQTTLETNRPGVFAAGDIVSGPASVIEAIAQGKKAAINIDKFLKGVGVEVENYYQDSDSYCEIGRIDNFAALERVEPKRLDPNIRKQNFMEIQPCLVEEKAQVEGVRCLKCDLRLQIKENLLPSLDDRSYLSK